MRHGYQWILVWVQFCQLHEEGRGSANDAGDNICQFVNAVFMEWKDKIGVYPPYITCVNEIDLNFVIRPVYQQQESIENVQSGVNGYATQLLNDNNDMLCAARMCLING